MIYHRGMYPLHTYKITSQGNVKCTSQSELMSSDLVRLWSESSYCGMQFLLSSKSETPQLHSAKPAQ